MPEIGAVRTSSKRELLGLRMWPLGSGFDEYLVF
jgi:hypothetical protein